MNDAVTPDLFWLTATLTVTALFWLPYILDRILQYGLFSAMKNPKPTDPPKAEWARRMMLAHSNAVENLVIFAPLVIVVHLVQAQSEATAMAAMVYFWARLAHYLAYTFGVPYIRTVLFFVSVGCQLTLAWAVLGG